MKFMEKKKDLWNIFSLVAQKTTNTANELTWSTNCYRPQYLDEFQEKRGASTFSDIEKLPLLDGEWDVDDLYKCKFLIRFVC